MKIKFIPIDFDYFDFEGKNFIRIIGRNDEGKRVCVVDNYEPNFWVILKSGVKEKDIDKIKKKIDKIEVEKAGRKTRVIKTEVHDKKFLGRSVKAIRVFAENHKDLHSIADEIGFDEVEARREYDISLISKYIIEKNVNPLTWYDIEGETLEGFGGLDLALEVDLGIYANKISESKVQQEFKPKILAFDIETDEFEIGKGKVLMISLCGENFQKVLTWKKCKISQGFVECFKDEAEMLEKFIEHVKEYDADLLVGYFSDGFDMPYLRAAAERNKVKLSLGLDGSQPVFSRGIVSKAKNFGIVHVDIFRFIEAVYSQYLQSETLGLDDIAGELLGENKKDFDFDKVQFMQDGDGEWADFFSYNLHDSCLTYKLAEKIWPDFVEFTKIMKEPIFDISRDSMSSHVENYIIHNLPRFNEISEKRPLQDEIGKRRMLGKYEGAFVFQPVPGLYEDICVFDFTSMHASIIVSFNISKSTILDEKEREKLNKKEVTETPEFVLDGKKVKYYFSKERGFFPELLNEVVTLRKKYKAEYKKNPSSFLKARSNAYKLLANASYGYLGFFGARYYCRECAASTLAFVRESTGKCMKIIQEKGHKIIFSDTDSIGFTLNGKSKKHVLDMLKEINDNLPGIMELELEDFYKRGLFVSKRASVKGEPTGAKKKYAFIDESGKLKIRGFETVRRDWCKLARELQNKVLFHILKEGNEKKALEILKEAVDNVKKRKINKKDLMIKTQLKKPISEYKSEGPHVYAAKKMKEAGIPVDMGMLIQFYIAESRGKKLIRERVKLPEEPGEYDIDYYLNNQILPAVENIFDVFNINFREVVDGESQKKLF